MTIDKLIEEVFPLPAGDEKRCDNLTPEEYHLQYCLNSILHRRADGRTFEIRVYDVTGDVISKKESYNQFIERISDEAAKFIFDTTKTTDGLTKETNETYKEALIRQYNGGE